MPVIYAVLRSFFGFAVFPARALARLFFKGGHQIDDRCQMLGLLLFRRGMAVRLALNQLLDAHLILVPVFFRAKWLDQSWQTALPTRSLAFLDP